MRSALALSAALFAALSGTAFASGPVQQVTNQAWRAVAVTPSDTADLALTTDAIYTAGTGANAACTMVVDFAGAPTTDITISFMTPGFPYPFQVVRVKSTGTTCTGILALYSPPH